MLFTAQDGIGRELDATTDKWGHEAVTVFQGIFLGFLIGSIVTMVCVWLAGGSLYDGKENAPDDAGTSNPRQDK